MTYQKVTGPLMANSHPGSYCGQDAYSDMLVTDVNPREREIMGEWKGGDGMMDVSTNNTVVRRLTPL